MGWRAHGTFGAPASQAMLHLLADCLDLIRMKSSSRMYGDDVTAFRRSKITCSSTEAPGLSRGPPQRFELLLAI